MAESVILRRRYGGIALPLRWYRVAVTVKWRCRYGGIAMPYQWYRAKFPHGMAFSCRQAPFFASGLRLRQVLNFGNNFLQSAPANCSQCYILPTRFNTAPEILRTHPTFGVIIYSH